MKDALRATLSGHPGHATRIIKNALNASPSPRQDDGAHKSTSAAGSARGKPSDRTRWPLGEVVSALQTAGKSAKTKKTSTNSRRTAFHPNPVADAYPSSPQLTQRSFADPAGRRNTDFHLFLPQQAKPTGLVVMLHGCTQDGPDFATGTDMNKVAEVHGLAVVYPDQHRSANVSRCWNWFDPAHQQRGSGEPAIIAGITNSLVEEFDLDRNKIFVAGLSAGGAMAAIMGETYPDLYCAVGVHSGLAYGSANDVMSAFAAMGGKAPRPAAKRVKQSGISEKNPRTIIFHGTADKTVHPVNAERIVSGGQSAMTDAGDEREYSLKGDGYEGTRSVIADSQGKPRLESWLIDGAGHAWSGGNPKGSYTVADGPDASAEMVRFFLELPKAD